MAYVQQGPFQFAVDTGSSITVISRELAAHLRMPAFESCSAAGGGGQLNILTSRVHSIAVGDASLHDHAVGVGDFLKRVSQVAGADLDGIIGYNFLNLFRVTIDYPGSTLELSPIAP